MCKEKELTEAAYRYYVDEACIEDIAKQLHRSYNYTRLIIKKISGCVPECDYHALAGAGKEVAGSC